MSIDEITETRQYLTFKLGNEIFATDVAKVSHHGVTGPPALVVG